MCQGNLAGLGIGAAADEPHIRGCMMRIPERAGTHERDVARQQPNDGMYLCCLKRLLECHRRQDARQPLRQHCLPTSRRTYQDDVMRAGSSHLQCSFDILLPLNIREIKAIDLILVILRRIVNHYSGKVIAAV